jgi:hypothetical protein
MCCIKLTLSESTAKESRWLPTQDWRQCGKGTRLSTVVADTSMITLSTAYTSHFQYKYVYTYIYLYITVYTYDNNVHTTDAALDATILYSLLHSLVQIRVEFLGVKPWSTEHINGLLELNGFPPVT